MKRPGQNANPWRGHNPAARRRCGATQRADDAGPPPTPIERQPSSEALTLTPAEELGLSGLSLDSRVRKAFYALPPSTLAGLIRRLSVESRRRHLIYQRDGVEETIRVLARPTGVLPDQLAYLHFVTLTVLNALKRLPEMYLADPEVRAVLPLAEPEQRWLRDAWGPSQRDNNPVIGRLDGVIEFTSPMWKDSLRLLEPNLSGVGGIHLCPGGGAIARRSGVARAPAA